MTKKTLRLMNSIQPPRLGDAAEKESASKWAVAAGVAGLIGVLVLLNYIQKKK